MTVPNILADLTPGRHHLSLLDENFAYLDGRVSSPQNVNAAAITRSTAPSAAGNWNSITTAFTGADLATVSVAVAHSITGASTLTQPATGYYYQNEAYPHLTYLFNSSGWNQSTSTNDGRTAAVAYRTKVDNYGQGDAVAYNVSGYVTGTRAGSTDFLANPAVTGFNGDFTAGAAGVYLNPGEFSMSDGGFDVAGNGWVVNLNRSIDTGAKNAFWTAFRAQSIGSADIDAAYSATGHFKVGLDFTGISLPASGTFAHAAVVLTQGMRIYGNGGYGAGGKYTATSAGLDWIERSTSGFWNIIYNNTSVMQLSDGQVTTTVPLQATSYKIAGTQVVGARDTGWTAMTGTPNKAATYDVATVTLAQLAARVAELQAILTAHGLIGA